MFSNLWNKVTNSNQGTHFDSGNENTLANTRMSQLSSVGNTSDAAPSSNTRSRADQMMNQVRAPAESRSDIVQVLIPREPQVYGRNEQQSLDNRSNKDGRQAREVRTRHQTGGERDIKELQHVLDQNEREIRQLRRANVALRQDWFHEELRASNLKRKLDETEAELEHAQKQRKDFRGEIRRLRAVLNDSENEQKYKHHAENETRKLGEAKKELREVKAQLSCTTANLEDCKEKIFNLQPFDHKSDNQICAAYRSLCESIADWVNDNFSDVENIEATIAMVMTNALPDDLHKFFARTETAGSFISTVAETAIVQSIVFSHLYWQILDPSMCRPGVPSDLADFLNDLENGMRGLQPRRGTTPSKF